MPSSSTHTSVSFGVLCRGDGKVYCLLEYEGPHDIGELTWQASSVVPHAGTVPSRVVLLESGRAVLVVPVLATEQHVSVIVRDKSGSELARADKRIDHRLARVMSKLNSAVHAQVVDDIRNCDRHPNLYEADLLDNLIITTTGGPYHIYQCSCTYALMDGMDISDTLTLEVYDQQGHRVSEQACSLGECCEDWPEAPGVRYRRVRLSAHIPMNLNSLVVQVRGKDERTPQGFLCIQPWDVADLRDQWGQRVFAAEDNPRYVEWFEGHRVSQVELKEQRRLQSSLKEQPIFSVIVPLYHTPLEFFDEMAYSVLAQSYTKLELILVNSTPEDLELKARVEELLAADERVRVVELEANRGITENTNAGIEQATGDFLCFFDHDDVLELDLLYHYAYAISERPDTDMLYCDEDKLEAGAVSYPFFKPDWDPILEETNNYVCHMLCVRRSLFATLERPDSALDGAQDHSLTLAVGEHARHVAHIKRVMYHWRIHEASTAGRTDVKQESFDAGRLAIERHFKRIGVEAEVIEVAGAPHCYNARYRLADPPRLSIFAAKTNADIDLETFCEQSLSALETVPPEIKLSEHLDVDGAVKEELLHFVQQTSSDYILCMRSDVVLESPHILEQLTGVCSRKEVGVAAPLICYPDATISHSGLIARPWQIAPLYYLWPHTATATRARTSLARSVTATEGVVMLFKRELLLDALADAAEGLDFLRWGIDACLYLRDRGFLVVLDPSVRAIERMGSRHLSADAEKTTYENVRQHAILKRKWAYQLIKPDPYYSEYLEQDGYYGLEK